MDKSIQKFEEFLEKEFPKLDDIKHTFEHCSGYNNGKNHLVSSQMKTINFDKLTRWCITPPPKSADSMSFSNDTLYLVEFKSGDPTTHVNKLEKIIADVTGKINRSDDTLSSLYKKCFDEDSDKPRQIFLWLLIQSKWELHQSPIFCRGYPLQIIGICSQKKRCCSKKFIRI